MSRMKWSCTQLGDFRATQDGQMTFKDAKVIVEKGGVLIEVVPSFALMPS
jgi:hypothetical protein